MAVEEVGPSIERGSQLVNGNWADLTIAANMIMTAINRPAPWFSSVAIFAAIAGSSVKLTFLCM